MEKLTHSITENEILETENVDANIENDQEAVSQDEPAGEIGESADDVQELEEDNFSKLYEDSLKPIQEGEVIKGEIVQIDKEYILVDIGYKSEGQIRINEFIDPEGNLTAKVGDRVEVLLERRESDDGTIILSK